MQTKEDTITFVCDLCKKARTIKISSFLKDPSIKQKCQLCRN